MSLFGAAVLLCGMFQQSVEADEEWIVEVQAGDHARLDALVRWRAPLSATSSCIWRVEQPDGAFVGFARAWPGDGEGSEILWIVPGHLEANETRRYRLVGRDSIDAPKGWGSHREEGGVEVSAFDDPILFYHSSVTPPPDGVDPVYARSAFVHPIQTPSGRVITGDSPPAHRHQRGVFSAWTKTTFQGRDVDFWNLAERKGSTGPSRVAPLAPGPVFGGFEAFHDHFDLTAEDGTVAALREAWRVAAFRVAGRNIVDIVTTQRAAGESPLVVLEYHYGGFAWRGPEAWTKDACTIQTDSGDDRVASNDRRPRWVMATGTVDGEAVTFAVLSHKDNFRGPQPVRIHPDEPYFCFSPCELGPFEIGVEPLVSRYRLIAADGPLEAEVLNQLYDDYVTPCSVQVIR